MKKLIQIENDCYFIAQRLKEIDESYFIVYNLDKSVYEVHSNMQKHSYCFTIPFSSLDERTILFALKTRVQNRDEIIKEIEKNNSLVYENNIKNQIKLMKEALCS